MENLELWQYAAIGLLFVWGGFVRSGLGFGGAVLTLPFLLMVNNTPLVYLPIISIHLLFFSGITVLQSHWRQRHQQAKETDNTVNWAFLRYSLPLMIVPKLIGFAVVITLPAHIVACFIFVMVSTISIMARHLGGFTSLTCSSSRSYHSTPDIATHMQEIGENAVDPAHFLYVHGTQNRQDAIIR